jgi:hypothetical protein
VRSVIYLSERRDVRLYPDPRDWWVGYYRGPDHHYVCVLPCIVLRWPRKRPKAGG